MRESSFLYPGNGTNSNIKIQITKTDENGISGTGVINDSDGNSEINEPNDTGLVTLASGRSLYVNGCLIDIQCFPPIMEHE